MKRWSLIAARRELAAGCGRNREQSALRTSTLLRRPDALRGALRLEPAARSGVESAKSPYGNDRSPDRRLKVGYVSPDFREHCQTLFTLPLFSRMITGASKLFAMRTCRGRTA